MNSVKSLVPLYSWLIDVKGYSEFDAEMTVLCYEGGFDLPIDVRKDVREYTRQDNTLGSRR